MRNVVSTPTFKVMILVELGLFNSGVLLKYNFLPLATRPPLASQVYYCILDDTLIFRKFEEKKHLTM